MSQSENWFNSRKQFMINLKKYGKTNGQLSHDVL